jgi:DNA recombination protein RmuC
MDSGILIFVVAVVAIIIGAVGGYLVARMRSAVILTQLEQERTRAEGLNSECNELRSGLMAEKVESGRLREKCEGLQHEIDQRQEAFAKEEERRREEFRQHLELVKAQLKSETHQVNRESIAEILKPYRDQLEELRRQSGESRATLETHIKTLVETGGRLSSEADRLARALSSDVRMQGNLGEKLLEDLLSGSGLIEGKQYLLQRSIRQTVGSSSKNEDTGRMMKPDAMIFYPATQSVLYIDSKFQLPADVEEGMDAAREEAVLKDFSTRLRTQVKSLASRGYQRYKYENYVSLPYVVMFVPSDKALMAVTSYDKTLWLDAFNNKVFIASERHLLMLIEMVNVAWVQQQQLDNQENIVKNAEILLNRVAEFIGYFDKIGQSLDDAQTALRNAREKGMGRGQTISVAANNIIQCGVKAKTPTRQNQLEAHLIGEGLSGGEE